MTRRLTLGCVAVALVALAAAGLTQAARTGPPPSLESQAEQIGAGLRCPTCQGLSVADSPSKVAVSMRDIIQEQLASGRSPEQVRGWFVDRYGEWILLSPPTSGLGWTVWLAPLALLLSGVGAIVAIVRRRRRTHSAGDVSTEEAARIADAYGQGRYVVPDSPAGERLESALALWEAVKGDRLVGLADDSAERSALASVEEALADLEQARAPEIREPADVASASPSRRAPWRLVSPRLRWAGLVAVFGLAVATALTVSIDSRDDTGVLTGQPAGGRAPSEDPEVAELRQQLRRDPGDARARLQLAAALLQAGRPAAAEAEADRLLDADPDDLDALLLAGIAALQQGDPGGRRSLRRFLDAAPEEHPGRSLADSLLTGPERP